MEQQSIVTTNTLEIQNLQYAHEQYDDFVDIHGPLLNVSEFKTRRGLPLNEQCAAVFYEKTMNLKDTDFIEIDRPMLQMIGFKNTCIEKKDTQGNVKLDDNGKPKLEDTRKDFNNAIRSLRKSTGFIEGTSLQDNEAHFVVLKLKHIVHQSEKKQRGGLNKLTIWLRKDMLQKWVQINEIKKTNKKIMNGLIYFIHMENNMKVFKIGYTTDLKTRLADLQVAHPYSLQVYATIENVSRNKETELHHLFKKKHVRGEWFAITPDMIDVVCKRNTNL